jgi:hypothetical protein
VLCAVLLEQQLPAAYPAGGTAAAPVGAQGRVVSIERKPAKRRCAAEALRQPLRTRSESRVIRVQHQQALRSYECCHRQLHIRKAVQVIDPVFAKVIRAHVRDECDFCLRDRNTPAQNPAARRFNDNSARLTRTHHAPRPVGAGIIAAGKWPGTQVNPVRAAESRQPALRLGAGGQQPHAGRLAVRACHHGSRHVMQRMPWHRGRGRQLL